MRWMARRPPWTGQGVRILNALIPPSFRESARCAEQNLYARAEVLVGDRDPRARLGSAELSAVSAHAA